MGQFSLCVYQIFLTFCLWGLVKWVRGCPLDPKSLLLILKHAIEIGYNNELIKVDRPSIFVHVRTPSISKSLILKQIDLYCKNSITNVLYIDSTLLWYYFWAIGINITWQWRHNKSNFCPYGNFLLKCFTLPFLWVLNCLLLCEVSQKPEREISRYLVISTKRK